MEIKKYYSKEENQMLIDEGIKLKHLKKEDFETYESLWGGMFGVERKASSLANHAMRLFKAKGIKAVVSFPFPWRKNYKKPRISLTPANSKSRRNKRTLQVEGVVKQELENACAKLSTKILLLMKELMQENKELKEEIEELKKYKFAMSHLAANDKSAIKNRFGNIF
jgi:hypothetical protein